MYLNILFQSTDGVPPASTQTLSSAVSLNGVNLKSIFSPAARTQLLPSMRCGAGFRTSILTVSLILCPPPSAVTVTLAAPAVSAALRLNLAILSPVPLNERLPADSPSGESAPSHLTVTLTWEMPSSITKTLTGNVILSPQEAILGNDGTTITGDVTGTVFSALP